MKTHELSTKAPGQPVGPLLSPVENLACWNQIGAFGDRSCPELHKYIHCHHCPVHSAAGLQLLDRALTSDYKRERTEHFARARNLRESNSFSAILFRLQAEWLALPTRIFQEVSECKAIHSLPQRRHGSLLGLSNVRGELILCVSMAHLLNLKTGAPPAPRQNYNRLLVIHSEGGRLAFPVDEVQGPYRFQMDQLTRSPSPSRTPGLAPADGVLHWRERAVGLVDLDALVTAIRRNFR